MNVLDFDSNAAVVIMLDLCFKESVVLKDFSLGLCYN